MVSGTLLWLHDYYYQNSYFQYIILEMFASRSPTSCNLYKDARILSLISKFILSRIEISTWKLVGASFSQHELMKE